MPAITKKQRTAISAYEGTIQYMFPVAARLDLNDLFAMYWTDEERAKIAEVERLVDRGSIRNNMSVNIQHTVTIPEGMPCVPIKDDDDIVVSFELRSTAGRLCPVTNKRVLPNVPDDVRGRFDAAMNDVVQRGLVRGYWARLFELYEECTTHEAMRYIFPGTVFMLRKMGYESIASEVETIKRVPPNLPTLSPYDRQVIRYMNDWFATQMLLDTFEGNPQRDLNLICEHDLRVTPLGDKVISCPDMPGCATIIKR